MTVPLIVSVAARPIFLLPRLIGIRPYDGFYFGNKFRKYYESCLPVDRREIEKLPIKFGAMSVNLTDLKAFPITHGSVAKAAQASSAIPILRRPVPFGDDALLVDGAMLVNLPVDEAKRLGADVVIAVPVSERVDPIKREQFRKLGSVARRMEQLFLSSSDAPEMGHADFVIHPNTDGINILSTNRKDAIKAIKAGEEAATAALPGLCGKLKELGVVFSEKTVHAQSPKTE